MGAEVEGERLARFADEVGIFFEDLGMPRFWGRVLGWLLVCEPDYQSADDLAHALLASRGSISMTTRSLIRAGMVERQTRRGDRRTYYGIRRGAWTAVFEQQAQTTVRLRMLAEQGLGLLVDASPERRRRLDELEDLTGFYEKEFPALLERWKRQHRPPG